MDTTNPPETNEFLSNVADAMEAAASRLESTNGAVPQASGVASGRPVSSNFGLKLLYSSCYSLSFGVCFPVFVLKQYVPTNNPLFQGLADGATSAGQSAEELVGRVRDTGAGWKASMQRSREDAEIAMTGAEALAPA